LPMQKTVHEHIPVFLATTWRPMIHNIFYSIGDFQHEWPHQGIDQSGAKCTKHNTIYINKYQASFCRSIHEAYLHRHTVLLLLIRVVWSSRRIV
jgi:hypothetical protein